MAKFEGNYPKKPAEAPSWFQAFIENYYFVVRYLTQLGKNGVNFSDLIINTLHTQRVFHGQTIKIPHQLGVTATSVQIQGGRYDYFLVGNSTSTLITVVVYLKSTPITDTVGYSNTNLINVLDPDIFTVGDQVSIDSQKRKILEIVGKQIRLDASVTTVLPGKVTLDSELLNFVIF